MTWISRIFRSKNNGSASGDSGTQQRDVVSVNDPSRSVKADKPIRNPEEDVLGRTKMARAFAEQIMEHDVTEGVVVGVLGPWGSGKTSFLNLVRFNLKALNVTVLDFNPWMFSGAEQLVESFFNELSAQLKLSPNLSEIGKALENYGEIFSGMGLLPLFGPWIESGGKAVKALAKILQRRKEGIDAHRTKVKKGLAALDKPIVVILDDIDRLTTSEIRDIFKLVRLTANFPNVIYIVAFDRLRVEEALSKQGLPGRDYLDKILQISVDLPAVPANILNEQILEAIYKALSGIDNPGPFDNNVWLDIFMDIIRPLIRNMRDVRRYAAAVQGTARDLNGQVALTDVLALEAIRVFLPDVFHQMHESVDWLTTISGFAYGPREDPPHLKEQIDRLIKAAGGDAEVVRALIRHLFPAAEPHVGGSHYGHDWKNKWLRERRVAHEAILRFYLERVSGEGLQAFTDAEQAWARMANREELDSYLRSIDPERLKDVIASLKAFEDQFGPEHVEPGTIVLLNLLPESVVRGVVYRLLSSLKNPDKVETAIRNILPHLTTLSAKGQLISIVRHRDEVGNELVSEAAAERLEKEWREEVRNAPVKSLINEKQLLRILLRAKRQASPGEPPLDIDDSPSFTLLRSARTEVRDQSVGSRAVSRSPLDWDALIELYGNEDTLRVRIEELKATRPEGEDELLQLADKYLGGWRPGNFDNE